MNKLKLLIATNIKIYSRINSEKRPLLYEWLRTVGIRMPPEILAYLIMLSFAQVACMGFITQVGNSSATLAANFPYVVILLILSVAAAEISIVGNRLYINDTLLKVIPLSRLNYILYSLAIFFISLRLWNFISFIIVFCIFYFLQKTIAFDDFFISLLILLDVFLLASLVIFVFTRSLKRNNFLRDIQKNLPIRLFLALSGFIVIERIVNTVEKRNTPLFDKEFLFSNSIVITFLALVLPTLFILWYSKTKPY